MPRPPLSRQAETLCEDAGRILKGLMPPSENCKGFIGFELRRGHPAVLVVMVEPVGRDDGN